MTWTLRAAAVYNLAWGALVVLAPTAIFRLVGADTAAFEEPASYAIPIWQCVGMIVGVYGIGYWFAADNPARHWPIVLVGLMGKILGPIGFVDSALIRGVFPIEMGATILTNDLIWWIPFGLMLRHAWIVNERERNLAATADQPGHLDTHDIVTASGTKLSDLPGRTLVVFLRHSGCTFCREALADIAQKRQAMEHAGITPVLVHMDADTARAETFFADHDLAGVEHIPDPDQSIYRLFELGRATIAQGFGLRVWLRGIRPGLIDRHFVGRLIGDGWQMPGVFLLEGGRIIRSFRHQDVADRPDYLSFATS
ncbi:MAG: SelL-related redox protein [Planctomycetota bacterium]